jgi:hypothetical protein
VDDDPSGALRVRFHRPGWTDDEAIALILAHVAEDHPDLAVEAAQDVRGWIELVAE